MLIYNYLIVYSILELEIKKLITNKSISVNLELTKKISSKIISQMLRNGFIVYSQKLGISEVIGQGDFNKYIDFSTISRFLFQ